LAWREKAIAGVGNAQNAAPKKSCSLIQTKTTVAMPHCVAKTATNRPRYARRRQTLAAVGGRRTYHLRQQTREKMHILDVESIRDHELVAAAAEKLAAAKTNLEAGHRALTTALALLWHILLTSVIFGIPESAFD
jgi:hypothetical protein